MDCSRLVWRGPVALVSNESETHQVEQEGLEPLEASLGRTVLQIDLRRMIVSNMYRSTSMSILRVGKKRREGREVGALI